MPLRLLHLADLHLDRAFAQMGCHADVARARRQGLRDALRRAGDLAREEGCDAICIGGDLYEHERAGANTARFLADTFAGWDPLPVLIAPGNHDALLPQSLYLTTEWPANVHLFRTSQLQPYDVKPGFTVWGLGHQELQWQGDPLAGVELAKEGVHVALFHGAELGSRPDGKSIHGPFRSAAIAATGFALALCGHYHKRRIDSDNRLIYPGSPEPLTFAETGGRGPVLVDIDDRGGFTVSARDTNVWHALTVDAEVDGAASLDSLIDSVERAVTSEIGAFDPLKTMVQVTLRGDVAPAVGLDVFTVESRLRDVLGIALLKVRDTTTPSIDIEAARQEHTTRGAFARALLQALDETGDEAEAAVLDDALRYGLMALSGAEVGLR